MGDFAGGRVRRAAALDRPQRHQHGLARTRGIARERARRVGQCRLAHEVDALQEHVDLRSRDLELPCLCSDEALLELVRDRRHPFVSHDARRTLE